MSAHKNCPICGSRPLELRAPHGDAAITCYNDHEYDSWDCPLMSVVMEPFEWDRRTEIGEEKVLQSDNTARDAILKDLESFCVGRVGLGVNVPAYKDVLFLIRQHIISLK